MSVLARKHDCQHSRGLFRVARVFGAAGHVPVVVVDLPEERLACDFEAAKIVLAEPVVVLVEVRDVSVFAPDKLAAIAAEGSEFDSS